MKNSSVSLSKLRKELLSCDKELIQILKKRFKLSQKIGHLKAKNKMDIKQPDFWKKSSEKRSKWGKKAKLEEKMVIEIFDKIHKYSLKHQER